MKKTTTEAPPSSSVQTPEAGSPGSPFETPEMLRWQRDQARKEAEGFIDMAHCVTRERDEAVAENARLRAALEEVKPQNPRWHNRRRDLEEFIDDALEKCGQP